MDDYSGPWRNETLTERERRALDYRNRFELQEEAESKRLAEANRLLIRDVSTNRVIVEQNTDAEKQSAKSNTNLSQATLDGVQERQKDDESEAPRGKQQAIFAESCEASNAIPLSSKPQSFLAKKDETVEGVHPPSPAPPNVTQKSGLDIAGLKNMLLKHNHGLTAEQITVQVLDGKVVRLEIISLYVRDISPASGLADLQALGCLAFKSDENNDSAKSAPVKDLTPLKGLQLRELNLFGTNVKDLAPLQGMPLETLDISNTNVKDLTPLKKLPLKSLNIKQTAVRDLNPIMKLPIERIWLDFSPSKIRRETDREFWSVLRRMPSLKFINDRAVAEFKGLL